MGSAASSPPRASRRDDPLLPLRSLLLAGALSHSSAKTRCEAPPPPPPVVDSSSNKSEPPPPPPPDSSTDDSIAEAAASVSSYINPGPYEQASMDAKRLVNLETFDGFRCDINKQVSPYMAAVHSFWLGTSMIPDGRKSTYTFLTQVADESGLLMARVDPGRGSVDGRIHRALFGGVGMAKLQLAASQDGSNDQCVAEVDLMGSSWTANLKYGSILGGLAYGCNYYQAITPKLHMGGEGMYLDAQQKLVSSYTLKYTIPAKTGEEDTLEAHLDHPAQQLPPQAPQLPGLSETSGSSTMIMNYSSAAQQATMNYKRVITPGRVTVGAELSFVPFSLQSQLLLGAEFKLQRSKYSLVVEPSALKLQSVLETKLGMAPGSPSLQFAAEVAPFTDEMRFGYGITVDG